MYLFSFISMCLCQILHVELKTIAKKRPSLIFKRLVGTQIHKWRIDIPHIVILHIHVFKIFILYWWIVDFQFCVGHNKVIQLYVYLYPLLFRFFPHMGHYRIFSRVPCAIQWALVDYFVYSKVHVNPNILIYPLFHLLLS